MTEGNQSLPHMPEKELPWPRRIHIESPFFKAGHYRVLSQDPLEVPSSGCVYIKIGEWVEERRKVSSLEKRLAEAEETNRQAIKTVNAVQNQLRGYTTNSSLFLAGAKEAWNINARFLSKNGELQNEYLEALKVVVESEKGGKNALGAD